MLHYKYKARDLFGEEAWASGYYSIYREAQRLLELMNGEPYSLVSHCHNPFNNLWNSRHV